MHRWVGFFSSVVLLMNALAFLQYVQGAGRPALMAVNGVAVLVAGAAFHLNGRLLRADLEKGEKICVGLHQCVLVALVAFSVISMRSI
ncbi:MAG: hypothetical protein JNM60_04000 [Candidatus Competibacteraceae bacterium]|nr:hypothetical protein [Candidatus Competibacteraceae bacterium]